MADHKETNNGKQKMLAIVRIRGEVNITEPIERALQLLKLRKKHVCVLVKDTKDVRGMLQKVKDYVAFGEVDDSLISDLVEKRGKEFKGRETDNHNKISYSRRYFEFNGKKLKPFFTLNSPKGGFERKGIKKPFALGGVLGNRKEKMAELIRKML